MSTEIERYSEQRGLSAIGDVAEMQRRLTATSEKLALVQEYIAEHFVKGVDYGPADMRNPKDVLLKPGAEKVCKLFNTSPRWRMDRETWEMLGSPPGTVCYLCEIIDNATGIVVGEGRGAEQVGNKQRDANKAIKIAEKCSLIDAALYTFNLSERFTQDLPRAKNSLNEEKTALVAHVNNLRTGTQSDMTTVQFLHKVSADYLHEASPGTIGAVKKLKQAIDSGMYDLATGERVK